MSQDVKAEIGVIGGTGLYDMEGLEAIQDLDLQTPYGTPSSTIRLGVLAGRRVAFLARHGAGHRYLPTEVPYRANLYALKTLGVSRILAG